ncbi:AAA family ATPase [Conexibacter sp. W3-3-2]|uniref:AAA family ATPase n=1 Tax=Conexibacter sp. W3-3-2 TaxID=2675227 RepID=UPI0012B847C7|nr:AAA family ATPase [Conexibacter sp. W3-3-2]MTD47231.1 AAA family ATPase [Conexibacter sp. W3-3-2]
MLLEQHPRHGEQLRVLRFSVGADDPVHQLSSVLCELPGVGPVRARQLIARFGDAVIAELDRDPAAVARTIPAITETQARALERAWRALPAHRELRFLLLRHRLRSKERAILRALPSDPLQRIARDPYVLTRISGISFEAADGVAREFAVGREDPRRDRAAVLHVLRGAFAEGHVYLPASVLRRRVEALSGRYDEAVVGRLRSAGSIVVERDRHYLGWVFALERAVSQQLGMLLACGRPLKPASRAAAGDVVTLTEQQQRGVAQALQQGVSCITGGPGSGKTATLRALAQAVSPRGALALCAPTGRAARRIQQSSGLEAMTIHRLLEWNARENRPGRDRRTPLREYRVVVVDEASMLDLQLFAQLLQALAAGTHLVLVGDVDQLPPVGAGRPFADLLRSGRVATVRLTQVFRQAKTSSIVEAARQINRGAIPRPHTIDPEQQDCFVLEHPTASSLAGAVADLVAQRLPVTYDLHPLHDIQVLALTRRGPAGTTELNAALRGRLNPEAPPISGLRADIRIGDRVIQTRNDYELSMMNGETAVVIDCVRSPAGDSVVLLDEDGRTLEVPFSRCGSLEPAYAITTHKAQGAEVPVAVVVVHAAGTHRSLLSRNAVYTAITRARELCVLVGDPAAIAQSASTPLGADRFSDLAGRLQRELVS